MTKRVVYISGPMTGLPDLNYPAFNEAALVLRAQGHHVENPAENQPRETWADYMRLALVQIAKCDTLYALPGWRRSKGARLEMLIARSLGLDVWEQQS